MLYLDPWLPPWLPDLTLRDLRVGDQTFDLRIEGVNGDAQVDVLRGDPGRIRRRSFALGSELLSRPPSGPLSARSLTASVPLGRRSETGRCTTAALGERGYILAAAGTFFPIPCYGRINSLLFENRFPVVDELFPCSLAQGISGAPASKLLNSLMFSRRIFAGNSGFRRNSLLFPCKPPQFGLSLGLSQRKSSPNAEAAADGPRAACRSRPWAL